MEGRANATLQLLLASFFFFSNEKRDATALYEKSIVKEKNRQHIEIYLIIIFL